MKNNFWEEIQMKNINEIDIKDLHNESVKKTNVPEWAEIDCPECSKQIPPSGIRRIGLCLNARNIGDIAVTYHCDACGIMNTVYFTKVCQNIEEFCNHLKNKKIDKSPITEEEMFELRYNNLIEKFYEGE